MKTVACDSCPACPPVFWRMPRNRIRLLVAFIATIAFFYQTFVHADDTVITATIDRAEIPLNQTAILTVTISGANSERLAVPDLKAFSIYSSGQSQNITIINGQLSSLRNYTYVLEPQALGEFTIPPFKMTQDGKDFKTDPIQVKVIQSESTETKDEEESGLPSPKRNRTQETSQKSAPIFCEAYADPNKVVVGQQITYSFKFYRKINLLDQPQYTPPKFTNFWMEDLPPEKLYYEIVHGERYVVCEINVALFPTTSGIYTIEPAKIKCQIQASSRARDPFSFFDEEAFQFFNSDPFQVFSGREVTLKTDPVVVHVEDSPLQGKPEDFSGAIGVYTIHSSLDKGSIVQNEPITLTLTLEGEGNIQGIGEPKIELGPSFKIYDSGHLNEIQKTGDVVRGKKVFKKVLIPIEAGSITIPSISFPFFNPKTYSYETVKTENISISVQKGKEEPLVAMDGDTSPKEAIPKTLPKIRQDIRFIKTDFSSFHNYSRLPPIPILAGSLSIPLIILTASLLLQLRRSKINRNRGQFIAKTAYRIALKKLKSEQKKFRHGRETLRYSELEKILLDYLSAKTGISLQSYLFNQIEILLLNKYKLQDKLVKDLTHTINELQFAHFAPSATDPSKVKGILDNVRNLLTRMEKEL